MGNFINEFTKLNTDILDAEQKLNLTILETKKDAPDSSELNNIVKNMNLYAKNIEKYSKFDINLIAVILSELLSTVENKNYIYFDSSEKTNSDKFIGKRQIGTGKDRDTEEYRYNIRLIMPSSHENSKRINEFYNDAIILAVKYSDRGFEDDSISFYRTYYTDNDKSQTMGLESSIYFGMFSYAQDFVDMVIDYKLLNKKVNISKNELKSLLQLFLTKLSSELNSKDLPTKKMHK